MFERLDFTLKLITPAFLAGAMAEEADTHLHIRGVKPRHRLIGPEGDGLRIPSLRGCLRFWFRAKEGGEPAEVAKREAEIFGSTDRGQGVRIIPTGQSAWEPKPVETDSGSALSYLGYGPLNYRDDLSLVSSHNKFAFRDVIPEGTEFSFRAVGTHRQIDEIKKCIRLLHLFGGLGGRSRRGWGAVEVGANPAILPEAKEGDRFYVWARRILESVWPEADRPSGRSTLPGFSSFYKGTKVRCFDLPEVREQDWESAMGAFFRQFQRTRTYGRSSSQSSEIGRDDHGKEARALTPTTPLTEVPLRLAFGLPYAPTLGRRSGNPRTIEYEGRTGENGQRVSISRRASPLFLKVARGPYGKLHGVALFLQSSFLRGDRPKIRASLGERGERGRTQWVPKPGEADVPPYTAVESFLGDANGWRWNEVRLP